MLPAGVTVSSVLTDAASVVTEFDALMIFVLAIGFGVWAVGYALKWARKARRG